MPSNLGEVTREQMLERPLPNAAEAERAILGAIILDNALMIPAAAALAGDMPEIFYVPSYGRIFGAMLDLHLENKDINPILIGEKLRGAGILEGVGGLTFITNLTYGLPHFANLKHYVDLVREKFIARQGIKIANKLASDFLEEETPAEEVLANAEAFIMKLRERQAAHKGTIQTLAQIGVTAREHIDRIAAGITSAISTGIPEIDKRTGGGITRTHLWLIVALEKHGKSALMKQIAQNVAEGGNRVLIFSREMSALENYLRILSAKASVPAFHINVGISDRELFQLRQAMPEVDALNIEIDTQTANIVEARARIREHKQKHPDLALVAWDYLQLMEGGNISIENRTHELEYIARQMKNICMDFEVGGLALAQFNNEGGKEINMRGGRPQIQYIAGSGEIRKACDAGFVLHTAPPKTGDKGIRKATLYLDLFRHGAPAVVPLILDGKTLEFFPRKDEAGSEEKDAPEAAGARARRAPGAHESLPAHPFDPANDVPFEEIPLAGRPEDNGDDDWSLR